MLLVGYSWFDVALGVLYVSLALIIVTIAYKKLLARLSRGSIDQEAFCVLFALEVDPASGELEFYFTTEQEKDVKLSILNENMDEIQTVVEKKATPGGNIVRFDSTSLSNGVYYYCLKTANQKTMKKLHVLNS